MTKIREMCIRDRNRDNLLCGCAASGENIGLTGAGRDFVCEAERLGIIIDVSHMSEKGFWDLCEVLNGPFMAGHSNSKKICPHPRNLTDEQFCEIVKRGGVAGINPVSYTHLDVYKRQVDSSIVLLFCVSSSTGGVSSSFCGSIVSPPQAVRENSRIAVSSKIISFFIFLISFLCLIIFYNLV